MGFPNTLPIKVGAKDASGTNTGLLGRIFEVDGRIFRLVKSTGTIAAGSGGLFVSTAFSSGVPTWSVAVNGTANNPFVVGVIPAIDTSGTTVNTTAFAAGDVFLVQISGPTQVQVASSNVINTTTNGLKVDTNGLAAVIATSIEGGAPIFYVGYATNTTAATSGSLRTVMLEGML